MTCPRGTVSTEVQSTTITYVRCPSCGIRHDIKHYYGERIVCRCGAQGELDCKGGGHCRMEWEIEKREVAG